MFATTRLCERNSLIGCVFTTLSVCDKLPNKLPDKHMERNLNGLVDKFCKNTSA